jgi:hypothetical protein
LGDTDYRRKFEMRKLERKPEREDEEGFGGDMM